MNSKRYAVRSRRRKQLRQQLDHRRAPARFQNKPSFVSNAIGAIREGMREMAINVIAPPWPRRWRRGLAREAANLLRRTLSLPTVLARRPAPLLLRARAPCKGVGGAQLQAGAARESHPACAAQTIPAVGLPLAQCHVHFSAVLQARAAPGK